MNIGVISDTHGFLDPRIPGLFAGVDAILHGGDIGPASLIAELAQIAPVTAVLGNNDFDPTFRETEIVQLGPRKFLIHHIVDPRAPTETLRRRVEREPIDVVIFGHTHKRFEQKIGPTLYFNPGYAGKPRFNLTRSVAILRCDERGVAAEFFDL